MAQSEYVAMERSELEDKLSESRKELFNLRFQKATGQLDNTARLAHVKRDVARILTELRRQDTDADADDGWRPPASAAPAATARRGRGRTVEADVDDVDDVDDVEDEEEA